MIAPKTFPSKTKLKNYKRRNVITKKKYSEVGEDNYYK